MGALRGGWQAENTMDGSFIAPLLHQHIWHLAHRYTHNLPFTAAILSHSFFPSIGYFSLKPQQRTKIQFFRFRLFPALEFFQGCLTLRTTFALVHPLTSKLFLFQGVKPRHKALGYQAACMLTYMRHYLRELVFV